MSQEIKRYFSAKEATLLADVSYRRLDTWVRREIIRPSGGGGNGTRRRRLFTFSDIVELRVLVALTASGVRLGALTACVARLRKEMGLQGEHALSSTTLVTDGKVVFRYIPLEDRLEGLDECGQFAFAFGLGEEISKLRNEAKALRPGFRYVKRERPAADSGAPAGTATRKAI